MPTSEHVTQKATYAQVLVDLDAKALDRRTFSYAIPDGLEDVIEIGIPVSVPFGRMKLITGYVVGFTNYVDPGIRVKELVDILDDEPLFDLAYLEFLDWIAQYYATPLMTVLSTALPASIIQKTRREVALNSQLPPPDVMYTLPRAAQQLVAYLKNKPGKGTRIRYLASKTGLPLKLANQMVYKLKAMGIVSVQSFSSGSMAEKRAKWVRFNETNFEAFKLTTRQQSIWDALPATPGSEMLLSEAVALAKTTPATLQKLSQTGCIEIFDAPLHRDRHMVDHYAGLARREFTLNPEQQRAVDTVLAASSSDPFLLYGVTGSGKTEVYMALTEAMLAQGKSVLILVPEISLTSHIAKRFIQRFGLDQLAIWHSQLSAGEKVDGWRRINQGDLKIIIGARSAIFTPLKNLGLIVMDEEHEGSFKQDSPTPRYHAKTLARELAKRTGATLVLGSATPDVETYYLAQQERQVLHLQQRYAGRPMAEVTVVDMRRAKQGGHSGPISAELQQGLQATLQQQEQAIILLNRRGFYTLILCNQCETALECPNCTVALTYHQYRLQVRCHYCGYEAPKPQYCPQCASMDLTFTGTGTQRLAESIAEMFPDARLLRLDSDVMQKKFAHRDIFDAFADHQADILIGTQMVAKGLDVSNVTLVGVVGADSTFSLPDYKASERGFQLLTQVAGRSGRGDKRGCVIVQSLQPQHPVILRAQDQDYEGFYQDELVRRQEFDFPPYSQLFRIIVSCPDEYRARHFLQAVTLNLKQILTEATLDEVVTLLGPAPCVIARIQGRYRYHVMIKNRYGDMAREIITRFYLQVQPPEDVHFLLDVDAQSFL